MSDTNVVRQMLGGDLAELWLSSGEVVRLRPEELRASLAALCEAELSEAESKGFTPSVRRPAPDASGPDELPRPSRSVASSSSTGRAHPPDWR